jgi:metal-responsive CopG/Arc/MetJ family transcriptional regulator
VRRIQVSLDDRLWAELNAQARQRGTTISELMRHAVRERYPIVSLEERKQAMLAVMGLRKGPFTQTVEEEVRSFRKGRLGRINEAKAITLSRDRP